MRRFGGMVLACVFAAAPAAAQQRPLVTEDPETIGAGRMLVESGVDYSSEPTTLVVFALEEVADGVMLTVTESGFDLIPLARRAKAFTANEQGWGMVVKLIEKYLVHAP